MVRDLHVTVGRKQTEAPDFVQIDQSGRFFRAPQTGDPLLLMGDAPWLMIGQASLTDMETYFETRAGQGFNCAQVDILPSLHINDGATLDGDVYPFVGQATSLDVTDPNETYWQRVDHMVDTAASNGIYCVMHLMDVWGWTQGGFGVMTGQSVEAWGEYGEFVGDRYKDRSNILWSLGVDYQPEMWSTLDSRMIAIFEGMRDGGATQPGTVHLNFHQSASYDNSNWPSLIDYNSVYTYRPQYWKIVEAYGQNPAVPALFIEAAYEGENPIGETVNAESLRRQMMWALTGGSPGTFYGRGGVWQFDQSGGTPPIWEQRLTSTSVSQLTDLNSYFESLPWWQLAPDDDLITSGAGTRYNGTDEIGPLANDWAQACRSDDGMLAVVYVPSSRTLEIDESRITGSVSGTWINASSMASQSASSLETPGSGDWLLVLEGSG